MTSFLLKKEIKMALFFALLFCAAVYFYQNNRYKSFTNYMDEAERYIDTYFGEDEEAFYEKLEEDLMYCFRQQDDIDRFVGYEGQLPENSQGSNYAIVPLDAMLWQQQQRNQPGRFTDTVWEDLAMLSSLRSAMQGMRNLSHNIENSKEIMRREMRRQDEEVFKYAACMKAYEAFDAMEKQLCKISDYLEKTKSGEIEFNHDYVRRCATIARWWRHSHMKNEKDKEIAPAQLSYLIGMLSETIVEFEKKKMNK